ncbi:MAG: MbnB/TglH/ChrH family RiPP precursor modification enzyme [Dehalococcoidia bacterium]
MFEQLPFLGAGLGYQADLHDAILAHRDDIDFLEVPVDQFMGQMPEWTDRLLDLKRAFTTVAHGVYMSLGDARGAHVDYLDRLAPFVELLEPIVVGDHIDMGNQPDSDLGRYLHGMPIPFTREQAAIFRRNMDFFADRLRRPLLVENIFYKFVVPMPDRLPEPVFISEILRDTKHGLILDITNLCINALNFGFDPYAWLEQAPLEHTVYIHVSGGEQRLGGDWDGKWADTHSQPVPDGVWRMVEWVVAQVPVRGILLERDQNYPPMAELLAELRIARQILGNAGAGSALNEATLSAVDR